MTSDVSEVLAPCPFCGSGARFVKHSAGVRGTMAFDSWDAVACAGCGATVGACDRRFRSKDDARKAWNTRAQPAVLAVPGWDYDTLYWLIRGTGYVTRGQADEIVQALLAAAPAIHEGGEHA